MGLLQFLTLAHWVKGVENLVIIYSPLKEQLFQTGIHLFVVLNTREDNITK